MKKKIALGVLAAIMLAGCSNGAKEATVVMPAGEIAIAMEKGEYERIYQGLTADFRSDISKKNFKKALKDFADGETTWQPVSELALNGGLYKTWSNGEKSKGMNTIIKENGEISGLKLMPLESYPRTDEAYTLLTYSLPMKGEWFVFWGGEDVLSNYHYEHESQRYAYDFIQSKDGYSYSGDPERNESYYAFGQEITAPQAGTVVHVVSDIPDNVPVGKMNEKQPAGNVVVIDHGNGEFSYMAHLKKDSVTVKVGDTVEAGDLVGLCGNSGNSSEAHLHFQISDGADLFDSKALRIKWENELHPVQGYTVNGGKG